jgi:hypothetical protein
MGVIFRSWLNNFHGVVRVGNIESINFGTPRAEPHIKRVRLAPVPAVTLARSPQLGHIGDDNRIVTAVKNRAERIPVSIAEQLKAFFGGNPPVNAFLSRVAEY